MPRPRHPNKDIEEVLREAEDKDWRLYRGRRYFKMYCPHGCKCWKTVHITPHQNYLRNLIGELKRSTCWERS